MKKLSALIILALMMACNSDKDNKQHINAFELSNIDSSVNSCDNFYHFAIGNWQKLNPIPETESRWMAFTILVEENKKKLLSIVDSISKQNDLEKGSEAQMIRDLYNTGVNMTTRNKEGIRAISSILSEIEQAQRYEDIIHLFGELAPLGIKTPISFSVGADKKNSSQNVVYASQSGLSLPDRDYYLSNDPKFIEIREKYLDHIQDLFATVANNSYTYFPSSSVLEVETKLAQISWSRAKMRDPQLTYNLLDFSKWDTDLGNIDLHQIFMTRGFKQEQNIIVSQPSYFESLDSLFKEVTIEDWKNYLTWNTLSSYASFMTEALEQAQFNFNSGVLRGIDKMKPLDERIYNSVNRMLGEPLGKLFVERYFDQSSKQYVSNMIENLRSAYRESIEELDWMSSETKTKALKKLEAFTYKVGYPDEWKDYSSLEISDKSYAQNVMNVRAFGFQRMLDKQGKPVDRKEWHMTPQMVNAYYNSANNEIVFPAGILQPPFFHKNYEHAINYGGIGAVIGHEFSHGFDDRGSQFDWDGNLNNWWTEEDRKRFEALAAKLGEQYSKYSPVDGMYVNGKLTMGENIADLGGVTLAYAALKKELNGDYPEPVDGFDWNQRFFLGWANIWKGNIKEEELVMRLKSDSHSPAEFRVNGPLVNFKPFDEAFGNCEGHAMHKADSLKIKIW